MNVYEVQQWSECGYGDRAAPPARGYRRCAWGGGIAVLRGGVAFMVADLSFLSNRENRIVISGLPQYSCLLEDKR
jgi:hypothetical protein